MAITVKNRTELGHMRRAGQIVAECHLLLRDAVKPGVTTGELNRLVHEYMESADDLLDALQQALRGVHILTETQFRMAAYAQKARSA